MNLWEENLLFIIFDKWPGWEDIIGHMDGNLINPTMCLRYWSSWVFWLINLCDTFSQIGSSARDLFAKCPRTVGLPEIGSNPNRKIYSMLWLCKIRRPSGRSLFVSGRDWLLSLVSWIVRSMDLDVQFGWTQVASWRRESNVVDRKCRMNLYQTTCYTRQR